MIKQEKSIVQFPSKEVSPAEMKEWAVCLGEIRDRVGPYLTVQKDRDVGHRMVRMTFGPEKAV